MFSVDIDYWFGIFTTNYWELQKNVCLWYVVVLNF